MNTDKERKSLARRAWRLFAGLCAALAFTYWAGREFGLGHDELFGYLLASVVVVLGAALVGALLFVVIAVVRRIRRGQDSPSKNLLNRGR
jgi:apolipoprotein N-acyltransferase